MASFMNKIAEKYICMSSSVNVYRNLKDFKFKNSLSLEDEKSIYNTVCSSFYKLPYSDRFNFERLDSKDKVIENFKKGAIYPDDTVYTENSYIGIRDDFLCFFKINAKEHIEIIGTIPGVNFFRSSHFAYEIESDLEEELKFSFNTKLGYLFEDISLVGNGLKLRAVLHLPAINSFNLIDFVKKKMKLKNIKFYNLKKFDICSDFYFMEYTANNEEEFSLIRQMDKFVFEIVDLEIENRRKLFETKLDYYKEKYERYKMILNSKKDIDINVVTTFISLCFLLQSLSLAIDCEFKFLYDCFMNAKSSCFLDEKEKKLYEISNSLMEVV